MIKTRRMKWAGRVGCMGEKRFTVKGPDEKRPPGSSRMRSEDNIKTNLREIG
jgi:hypothetical protein